VTARLVLVATPIGNLGDLPPRAVDELRGAGLILCEDTRRTGKLLHHAGISGVRMAVANEHTELARAAEMLEVLDGGASVALVTDAGTPGISDPGERLVRAALAAGHAVTAVPGPAALVMALVVSGFDTTRFVFEGFLPRSGGDRARRLDDVRRERRTVVVYEAPHRVRRTIEDLPEHCGDARRVVIARELTKLHEEVWLGALADAVAHVHAGEPRGVYVLVVEGAPRDDVSVDDDAIRDELRRALDRGDDRRSAVATVTSALGVPRRRVYEIATSLPR
jgi:16S rRNA (cytidine1402-2'-O)-methyltransferase